ncbi:hypothetical protein GCM10009642_45460 [Nocardiopsis metallicus]
MFTSTQPEHNNHLGPRAQPYVWEVGHMWTNQWTTKALCRQIDPDALFVQGAAQNRAKLFCQGCPVRTECLADALDHRVEFGVWGGMTERERRSLLRKHPEVTDWGPLLKGARGQGADDLSRFVRVLGEALA